MSRLIDADVLIVKAHQESKGMSYPYREDFGLLVEWIADKTPSVQPQTEIIRCKDCKYYDGFGCSRYADETFGMTHSTQEYGFCWLAERRTE